MQGRGLNNTRMNARADEVVYHNVMFSKLQMQMRYVHLFCLVVAGKSKCACAFRACVINLHSIIIMWVLVLVR